MPQLREYYPAVVQVPKLDNAGSADSDAESTLRWLLSELVQTYGYPESLLLDRCTRGSSVGDDGGHDCAVSTIASPAGHEAIVLVAARPGCHRDAEDHLRSLLLASPTAGHGVASDGSTEGTVFLRRRFDAQRCEYISDLEPYSRKSTPGSLFAANEEASGPNALDNLTPLSERIENLFFELHSHIRDIDGLHADEALDELCKLIYVKLYDEERAEAGKELTLVRQRYGTSEELAADVRALYGHANEYDVRVYRLKIPQYDRSRGVFNQPLRLSSPAVAAVMTGLEKYSLLRSRADVKGRAFQRVLGPAVRSGMGQYFTPEPVIKLIVETALPQVTDLVLDPFCGSAHFLSRSLEYVRNNQSSADTKAFHEFAFGKLHGIEKSDRMVRVAMTDMRLHGDGHSNIRNTDSLLDFTNYPDLEPDSFDLILTNPPFGSLLGSESLAQLGHFSLAASRKRVPLEILGLERCLQFLRPGGRMVIVLPDSVLCNRGTQYVRDWLQNVAKIRAIVSLPIEAFSPFGANIKTSLLYLRKWETGELKADSYPVCLVRVDSVGYDASGRPCDCTDLDNAECKLTTFFKKEGW